MSLKDRCLNDNRMFEDFLCLVYHDNGKGSIDWEKSYQKIKSLYAAEKRQLVRQLVKANANNEDYLNEIDRLKNIIVNYVDQTTSQPKDIRRPRGISPSTSTTSQPQSDSGMEKSSSKSVKSDNASDKCRQYSKRIHYPIVKDQTPDGLAKEPNVSSFVIPGILNFNYISHSYFVFIDKKSTSRYKIIRIDIYLILLFHFHSSKRFPTTSYHPRSFSEFTKRPQMLWKRTSFL
jgi:hypothetical protein